MYELLNTQFPIITIWSHKSYVSLLTRRCRSGFFLNRNGSEINNEAFWKSACGAAYYAPLQICWKYCHKWKNGANFMSPPAVYQWLPFWRHYKLKFLSSAALVSAAGVYLWKIMLHRPTGSSCGQYGLFYYQCHKGLEGRDIPIPLFHFWYNTPLTW